MDKRFYSTSSLEVTDNLHNHHSGSNNRSTLEHSRTGSQSTNGFPNNDSSSTFHRPHPLSQSGKGLYMMDNNHDHVHASYSISNGQYLQEVDAKDSKSNNNSHEDINSKSRRTKNLPSLDRLHTQNLVNLRPATPSKGRGQGGGGHDDVSEKDFNHHHHNQQQPQQQPQQHHLHQRLHPDVFNPDKKRPTTSALTTSICSTVEAADYKSFDGISRIIHRHFSRVDYVRSDEQLEKEKYLIGKIKFNRWIFLPAAFFFQGVCGTLYACKCPQALQWTLCLSVLISPTKTRPTAL